MTLMSDQSVINLVRAAKIASGEWARNFKPSKIQVISALREINRHDVAGRIEAGRTTYVLKD